MSDIEWKDGMVCFSHGCQYEYPNLGSESGIFYLLSASDFQLNEPCIGDYITKEELDTEVKYNDVVEVLRLFGFEFGEGADNNFYDVQKYGNLTICHDGVFDTECTKKWCKRKLTYSQLMAIGKLKRLMDEKSGAKSAPEIATDNVKSPNHYQLMNGVESIEIIARSMTKEQWKGFCLGNMLKYRIRAGKKDALQQDIDKANFYGELYEMHKGKCYE